MYNVVEHCQPQLLNSSSQELVGPLCYLQLLNLLPRVTSARHLGQLQEQNTITIHRQDFQR